MVREVEHVALAEPARVHLFLAEVDRNRAPWDTADANTAVREDPDVDAAGEDILIYGSIALVNTLLVHKLIDEYRLMNDPLVLGTGKRFFRDATTRALSSSEGEDREHRRHDARLRAGRLMPRLSSAQRRTTEVTEPTSRGDRRRVPGPNARSACRLRRLKRAGP